jgi:hypothetical protein
MKIATRLSKIFLFFVPLASISFLLFSADSTQMETLEKRISSLEKTKDKIETINPSTRPFVKDGIGLFLKGDVLFWQASEQNLGYGIENSDGTIYLNDGKTLIPHFDWNWGFKVGIGYNIPFDGWDLFFQWTRFYTHNGRHGISPEANSIIFPTFVNAALPTVLRQSQPGPIQSGFLGASSYWNLKLNLIDGELGREFIVKKWLTLRPFAGLRNAWIRQHFRVNYHNGTIFSGKLSGPFTGQTISVRMKNNFWGLGLRGGINTQWGFGEGFSAFGDLAAAILVGNFRTSQLETNPTNSSLGTRLNFDEEFAAARGVIDMALGIRYACLVTENRYSLQLQLGWEEHLFFNQNQLMKFPTPSSFSFGHNYSGLSIVDHGDLDTHGITFSARFDF